MNYVPRNFQAECGRGPAEASVLGSTLWHIAENVNVYVVIDALDELDAVTQKTLIAALGGKPNRPRSPEACSLCRRSTIQSSTPRLRLIVTSRDSSLVDPLDPRIDLSAGEARARVLQGVKLFLASGIDSLAQQGNGFSSQALQKVKPWFLSHAHKGFLWATLGLVALKYGMRDPQQTRFQIPESLDALYALLLESSINKFPRLAHNILKTLKWILLAQRPLTVDELAGTFCFKYSELGEIGSVPPSVIRHNHDLAVWEPLNELCGTFIQVVDSKVYFAHRTVRDFLFSSSHSPKTLQKSATHFRPVLNYSEDGLARHCLEYIVSASSDSVLLDRYGDPSAAISLTCRFPFLSYAAVHWFDHAYVAKNSDPKLAMLTDTLSDPKSPWFRAWFPVYWFSQYTEEWQQKKFPIYPTRLVVLALLGSEDGILQVLNDNHALADEFTPAGEEWTPLLAAVWNGHERVMDLLLKFSDTWLESSRTIQAVTYALERGHPSLAKRLLVHYWRTTPTRPTRLLNTGVDDDERDLLMLAIINGYADIVDLLMNNGCNPNPHRFATSQAKSPYVDLALPTSPLGLAAFLGDVKLSMILLENGASVSASHALREAAKSGLEDIIDVLLKYDSSSATVNDEHQIGFGRTPLSYAAASGHAAMVRLLLERGANPELQDSFGWQPLHWAAVSGSIEVFRLLLDQPGLTRRQLTTAFYAACSSAKASVVRLILDNGKFKDSLAKKDILQTATRQIFANQRFVPFSAQGRGAAPVLVTHEHQRLYTLRAILQATRTDHDAAEISLELLPCVSRRQETNTVRYLLRSLDKVSLDNPILGSSFDAAARSGNDGLLRAYIGKGVPIRSSAWRNAAESGCHQAVKTICMAATTGRNHVDPPPYYWLIPQPAASKPQLGEPSLDSGSSSCFSAIPLQYREAAEYLNELHIRPNQRIDFSQEDDLSWTNRFKSFVEDRTGTSWIWYPLGPRLHQLRNGEVWLKWTCVSLHVLWLPRDLY
jgi:ankyrin repeat protein